MTRLQLADGYVKGTLIKEQKILAESNVLVMKQVETLRNTEVKPKRRTSRNA